MVYYDEKQRVVGWGLESGDALGPSRYPKPGIYKVCACYIRHYIPVFLLPEYILSPSVF